MTEDILERAKAVVGKCHLVRETELLLPELIAEVERLRSLNESLMENGNDLRTRCQKAEARIKELEADRIEARAQYLLFMNDNPGCIAWNFDELDETEQDALREQARYMLELEEPWAYIQLREAREQIKRLEAAFLKSETERKFYTTINGMNSEFDWNGYPECPQNGIHKEWFRQQARDVLKRIRKGELREAAINKLLSMKKLEVIEQIKEEIRSGKDDRSLSEVGLR